MSSYFWIRQQMSQRGVMPIPTVAAPNEVIDIGSITHGDLVGAELKRIIVDAHAFISIDGGQDPPAADWFAFQTWIFSIGFTTVGTDPPPDPTSVLVGGTVGTGALPLVTVPTANTAGLVSAYFSNAVEINLESKRKTTMFEQPWLRFGARNEYDYDLNDPFSSVLGSWGFFMYARTLWLLA